MIGWLHAYYWENGGLGVYNMRWEMIPKHQDINSFNNGIAHRSQLNGKDYKSIIKQIIPILINNGSDDRVVTCFDNFADIYYLATAPYHTEKTLGILSMKIREFNLSREVLVF